MNIAKTALIASRLTMRKSGSFKKLTQFRTQRQFNKRMDALERRYGKNGFNIVGTMRTGERVVVKVNKNNGKYDWFPGTAEFHDSCTMVQLDGGWRVSLPKFEENGLPLPDPDSLNPDDVAERRFAALQRTGNWRSVDLSSIQIDDPSWNSKKIRQALAWAYDKNLEPYVEDWNNTLGSADGVSVYGDGLNHITLADVFSRAIFDLAEKRVDDRLKARMESFDVFDQLGKETKRRLGRDVSDPGLEMSLNAGFSVHNFEPFKL